MDIKNYPYQVSIRWSNKKPEDSRGHFCGGAIIDKNHILSAAHCFILDSHDSSDPIIVRPEEITAHVGICSARTAYGDTVKITDYPYQVSIRWSNKEPGKPHGHFCGGAIIDKSRILSAAHCFILDSHDSSDPVIVKPEEIAIHAGTVRLDNEGSIYEVTSITNHPDYDSKDIINDMIILKLSKVIKFGDTQKPVDLPSHNIEGQSEGTVTGWGEQGGLHMQPYSKFLQKDELIVVDKKTFVGLADSYGFELHLDNKQICAYNNAVTDEYISRGHCIGDSGGPLVSDNKLVGVVSRTIDHDCSSGVPDAYTNVYAFLTFIKENIKK